MKNKPIDNIGVHKEHCCKRHGCKYGEEDCPVQNGKIKQSYPCEEDNYSPCFENESVNFHYAIEFLTRGLERDRIALANNEGDKKLKIKNLNTKHDYKRIKDMELELKFLMSFNDLLSLHSKNK